MKLTPKGQLTIPPAMRKKHGFLPLCEIELIDQPDGVLVVRAGRRPRGRKALAALLRGGQVKGRTEDWLRLTRGDA